MAKPLRKVPSPARRASADKRQVIVAVRALPEQKAFLARLGDGNLCLGFDRAIAHAVEATAPR